jgi:CBS domain-containing membrane protein
MSEPPGPVPTGWLGGHMAAAVRGLVDRLRLTRLAERHDSALVMGAFAFVNGCLAIAVMSVVALLTGSPFVFPSLGPTAFLHFYTAMAPAASPRNTVLGHLIGVAAAVVSLALFGLSDAGPALSGGMSAARVGAVALSLGLTSGAMVWLRVPHPPAGATTMIISLGILTGTAHLAVLMLAVVLLTMQAFAINRLAGLPYPRWAPPAVRRPPPGG